MKHIAAMGAVALAMSVVLAAKPASPRQSDRFPFVVSYGGATNATSVAHFLDAPAGKHGFVRAKGGEFVTDARASSAACRLPSARRRPVSHG